MKSSARLGLAGSEARVDEDGVVMQGIGVLGDWSAAEVELRVGGCTFELTRVVVGRSSRGHQLLPPLVRTVGRRLENPVALMAFPFNVHSLVLTQPLEVRFVIENPCLRLVRVMPVIGSTEKLGSPGCYLGLGGFFGLLMGC